MTIHLQPMPQADLALPVDAIDLAHPLVLPRLRQDQPAAAALSGSVAPAAGALSVSPAAKRPSGKERGVGEPAPPPAPPTLSTTAAGQTLSALETIAHERRRQVEHFGHTAEEDRALRPRVLPDRAIRALTAAIEDLQFSGEGHRARARHHLAQAGALCAAAIDWLDAGGGQ